MRKATKMEICIHNKNKVVAGWELRGKYTPEEAKMIVQLAYTSNHNSKNTIDQFLKGIMGITSGKEIKELYYQVGWTHIRADNGTPNKDKETRDILKEHPEYRIKISDGVRHTYIYHPSIIEIFKPKREDKEQQELEKICTEEFTDLETLKAKGITYETIIQIIERHKLETEKEFTPSLMTTLKDGKGNRKDLINKESYIVTTKKWSRNITPQYAKPTKKISMIEIVKDARTYEFPKLNPELSREAELEMADKYLTVMNKIRLEESIIGLSRKNLDTIMDIMNKEGYTSLITDKGEFQKEKVESTIKEIKNLEKLERHYAGVFSWHNLRFINKVVKRCSRSKNKEEIKELEQYGHIGLLEALRMYEPRKNTKFITYAVWRIRQEIYRGIKESHPVQIEPKIREAISAIRKADEKFLETKERTPTKEDYLQITNLSEADIGNALDAILFMKIQSLNEPISKDTELGDLIQDESSKNGCITDLIESKRNITLVREVLKNLHTTEADVLKRRSGIDCEEEETLEDIGKTYDLSRERIRQIEKLAEKKFKELVWTYSKNRN